MLKLILGGVTGYLVRARTKLRIGALESANANAEGDGKNVAFRITKDTETIIPGTTHIIVDLVSPEDGKDANGRPIDFYVGISHRHMIESGEILLAGDFPYSGQISASSKQVKWRVPADWHSWVEEDEHPHFIPGFRIYYRAVHMDRPSIQLP